MRTLEAYDRVLRSGHAVVMGDLNSGTNLNTKQSPSKGHSRILDALADLGLVSAYHAFHNIEHGHETHPTYRHQHKPPSHGTRSLCFVLQAGSRTWSALKSLTERSGPREATIYH